MYKINCLLAAFIMSIISAGAAAAHSGGTDSNGCHYNHKTGGYHCH